MTNRDLDARISRAMNKLVPSDTFDTIVAAIPDDQQAVTVIKTKKTYKYLLAAAATVVLLLGGVLGSLAYRKQHTVDTRIDIDVNPSIEISINAADIVLSVEAYNTDGERVLDELALENTPLKQAVTAIFDSMVEKGFVGNASAILITVQNDGEARRTDIKRQINTGINAVLEEHDVNASVSHQTLSAYDEAKLFAGEHHISVGKAAFILGMVQRDPSLDADKLADYHFAALASVAKQRGIDLHELVDYNTENAAWGDLDELLQQQIEKAEQKLGIKLLTPNEAKTYTGFDETFMNAVVFVKFELAWEEDVPVYQMQFISDEAVYNYVISAIDGCWLPTEEEKHNATAQPPQTIHSTMPNGSTTFVAGQISTTTTAWIDHFIGEKAAVDIAMQERKQVGCDIGKAENLTVKLHYNGEKSVYLVTFTIEDTRYTHSILATDGTILHVEKAFVSTTTTTTTIPPTQNNYILRTRAINLALTDAGTDVIERVVQHTIYSHLHDEGDEPYWRVEFCTDTTRWGYRVHAESGAILHRQQTPLTEPPSGLN